MCDTKATKLNESRCLFLCGVGRSGTTILRTSLGEHKQIYYNGYENNIVQELVSVAERNCTLPSRKVAMAVGQPEYNAAFCDLIRRLIWPDSRLQSRPVHLAAINPAAGQMPFFRELFPASRFVCLIRNGLEVVSSRMEYPSFAEQTFESHCEVWNRSVQMFQWAQQHPDVAGIVRHEWFYDRSRLQKELGQLFDWLQIDNSETPLQKILGTLRHPTSSSASLSNDAFGKSSGQQKRDYFLAKRDRWKSWTAEQKAIFDKHCRTNMQHVGYEMPW